jgi:hypothetical protein
VTSTEAIDTIKQAFPAESWTTVTVNHKKTEMPNCVGLQIHDLRRALRDIDGYDPEAEPMVNGQSVPEDYVLREGDSVTFSPTPT